MKIRLQAKQRKEYKVIWFLEKSQIAKRITFEWKSTSERKTCSRRDSSRRFILLGFLRWSSACIDLIAINWELFFFLYCNTETDLIYRQVNEVSYKLINGIAWLVGQANFMRSFYFFLLFFYYCRCGWFSRIFVVSLKYFD